jgi:antitoxin (DNA-binding transcriptional repressor) of toxin-antitoxin stability system
MPIEITFEDLEAHYFETLKRVCQGESFTVTVDGRQVAEIRPSHCGGADEETVKILEELCSPRFEGASDETIREWLGEGPR